MEDIVIFGVSRFAELVHFYLTSSGLFTVRAFVVDRDYLDRQSFCGLPVVAFDEAPGLYPPGRFAMFIAIGYSKLNRLRESKYQEARRKGYALASYVHATSSRPANVRIGDNVLILEQNILQPFAEIGNNVIAWSNNLIGHHSRIGDHSFLTSNTLIGGETELGQRCFLGVGANIGPKLSIGNDCIIGAGCLVMSDAAAGGVYSAQESRRRAVPSHRVSIP
jgi:sugar O-acyltransferase (sialic acid O-acetyltransferase NeuD family)